MRQVLQGISDETNQSLFISGCRDTVPVLLGIVPFGIIIGFTAADLGFTAFEITAMSAVVFAGAAQLAATFLMADGTHFAIVVLTVIMINIRFMMYSASLAAFFNSLSRLQKSVYGFLISDATYALSIPRLTSPCEGRPHWYYFGSGFTLWVSWIIATAIGASMGVGIPEEFPVELVLPVVFIALLFPVIEDRPTAATALVAGVTAIVAAPLDYNLGLLVGVSSGLVVGVALNR